LPQAALQFFASTMCSSTVFERADSRQEKSDHGAHAAYVPS
jgi:hypothetical protein